MRKKLLLTLVMLGVLAGAGAIYMPKQSPEEVEVIYPKRGRIESVIRVTGRVINDRMVVMTALVDGEIQFMGVQRGDKVEAGQMLVMVDERVATALLKKARAELERSQQAVAEAERKLARHKDLSRSGGASIQVVEDIEADWLAAKANLAVAGANFRVAEIRREKVEIKAPFDGIVVDRKAEVGQWVEAGTELFTLIALKGREIEANVDAGDSGAVRIGQSVRAICDGFPGKEWETQVKWIAPLVSQDEGESLNTFAVRMKLGSQVPPLLLNQQVDLRILTAWEENALKLPLEALIESGGKTRVALVRDGKVEFREVTLGIEDFTHVQITSGLATGDRVILPNDRSLKEGQPVSIAVELGRR